MRTYTTAVGLLICVGVLAGCQHLANINKAGGRTKEVTVITLQLPDGGDPDATFFAHDVGVTSDGTLRVVIDQVSYRSTDPSYGARLVAAMRSGQVGFSYDPARDWAAAGVATFQALQEPFLITTVHASELLANSPIAAHILQGLSTVGMVGIGLIPTQPRQILSTRPLFTASSFNGLRLRIINNPQTATTVRALDARPVANLSAQQVSDGLESRSIDGLETSVTSIASNTYNAEAPYLTSYAVMPKFETIVSTRAAWAALSPAQQAAIRQAAANTLSNADQVPSREGTQLIGLCKAGLVIDQPSPHQFTYLVGGALGGGIEAGVRRTATERAAIGQIFTITGTGPELNAIPVPPGCHIAHTVTQAKRLGSLDSNRPKQSGGGPTIPPGTYVTTDTAAEFAAGDVTSLVFDKSMTEITTLYSDGKLNQIQRPTNPHQPRTAANGYYDYGGHYVVNGNQVTFFWPRRAELLPETLRWSYYNGQLTFAVVHVEGDTAGVVQYLDNPWRRVN